MFKADFKIAAKDSMNLGDRIFLPITVKELPLEKKECFCNEEEVNFIRGLELYKVFTIFCFVYYLMCVILYVNYNKLMF